MDIKIIKDVCIFDKNRLGYLHFLTLDKDFGFGYNKISLFGEIFDFQMPYITYKNPQYPMPIVISILTKNEVDLSNKIITFLKEE